MATTADPTAGAVPGWLPDLPVEPEPDRRWTSDHELDRLVRLATSLHHWSPVYDRWRGHQSAAARPQQPRFDRADLSAIDELRGLHFGLLAAASRRLRHVGAALNRVAESTTAASSALAQAWRDGTAQRAAARFDQIQGAAQDCAALCERLGLHLHSAIIDTVGPVITSAVDEILARSRRWEQATAGTSREIWEQRIAELDAARPADPPAPWQAELDALVVDYDAVLGLFRATLTAAATTVTRVYRELHRELASREEPLSGAELDVAVAALGRQRRAAPGVAGQQSAAAPASTALASAGSTGADAPSAGSSSAGGGGAGGGVGGGGADPGTGGGGVDGSALLGELSDPPASGSGGAVLASASEADPGYGSAAAGAGAGVGGQEPAPAAGAPGSAAAEQQQRTGRAGVVAASEDKAREASWARLRALLGEDGGAGPDPGRAGR